MPSRRVWSLFAVAVGCALAFAVGVVVRRGVDRPLPLVKTAEARAFLGPISARFKLDDWTVRALGEVPRGALPFELASPSGSRVSVDVFRRDDAGPRPVATTRALALYLHNQADESKAGQTVSDKDQSKAVEALARALQAREDSGAALPALTTQAEARRRDTAP